MIVVMLKNSWNRDTMHFPMFRISEHKEFVTSNDVDVWLVFFPYEAIYHRVKVLHFKQY